MDNREFSTKQFTWIPESHLFVGMLSDLYPGPAWTGVLPNTLILVSARTGRVVKCYRYTTVHDRENELVSLKFKPKEESLHFEVEVFND